MKGIKYTSDIVVGKIIVATRNCMCSNESIQKDTIGVISKLKGSNGDGFDFKYGNYKVDVCIKNCGANPRFRIAYKNKEKLYETSKVYYR